MFSSFDIFLKLCILLFCIGRLNMAATRVAIVTGSNKGIGYSISEKLCAAGVHVIIACRDDVAGIAAANRLADKGYHSEFRIVDISTTESIDKFLDGIKRDFDSIDILVNNAAIAFKGSDPTPFAQQAWPTINTNYFGTLRLTEGLLPLIEKSTRSPRIVNVASSAGHLRILSSKELVHKFLSPTLRVSEINELMNQFVRDVQGGSHSSRGWPNTCYGMSKLGVIALTRVMAKDLAERKSRILVNSCCPGYCRTDMSSQRGNKSAEEGAETPVLLATALPDGEGPSGKFFYEGRETEW